jgi:hypothetical protein
MALSPCFGQGEVRTTAFMKESYNSMSPHFGHEGGENHRVAALHNRPVFEEKLHRSRLPRRIAALTWLNMMNP